MDEKNTYGGALGFSAEVVTTPLVVLKNHDSYLTKVTLVVFAGRCAYHTTFY